MPNGASRGTVLPVRISMPACSIVRHGSVASERGERAEQGHVDVLAPPGPLAQEQRGERSDDCEKWACEVAERNAAAYRASPSLPDICISPLSA